MTCAWQELLAILPPRISAETDRRAKDRAQEIRLRLGGEPEIVCGKESIWLDGTVHKDDLNFCINTSSRYSPWSAQTTAMGYITVSGGHRIGICGEAVVKNGCMTGFRRVSSVCIRVARDFPGIADALNGRRGSTLIIGAPGSGKTTLLRDLVRQTARRETVCVVDERGEVFPDGFARGKRMDILRDCPKYQGIDMLLRTMGPDWIAVDEITAREDCDALLRAGWCGVGLFATAHAGSLEDLGTRPLYRPILDAGLFSRVIILSRDKTWREERLNG